MNNSIHKDMVYDELRDQILSVSYCLYTNQLATMKHVTNK